MSTAPEALTRAAAALWRAARRCWPLALGAALAVAGIWMDKWVYWVGGTGLRSQAGFLHFPRYDSVMFFAHLSVLPALAALAAFQEGPLAGAMRDLRAGISGGDTLNGLAVRAGATRRLALDGLLRIFGAQVVLSAGLVLVAPALADAAGLRLDQFLLLRVGLLAAALHALFLAASAMIALTNAGATFAWLQAMFLVLNLGLTLAISRGGEVGAAGLTLAAALAATVAIPLAAALLGRLVRRAFLDGNESLYG